MLLRSRFLHLVSFFRLKLLTAKPLSGVVARSVNASVSCDPTGPRERDGGAGGDGRWGARPPP